MFAVNFWTMGCKLALRSELGLSPWKLHLHVLCLCSSFVRPKGEARLYSHQPASHLCQQPGSCWETESYRWTGVLYKGNWCFLLMPMFGPFCNPGLGDLPHLAGIKLASDTVARDSNIICTDIIIYSVVWREDNSFIPLCRTIPLFGVGILPASSGIHSLSNDNEWCQSVSEFMMNLLPALISLECNVTLQCVKGFPFSLASRRIATSQQERKDTFPQNFICSDVLMSWASFGYWQLLHFHWLAGCVPTRTQSMLVMWPVVWAWENTLLLPLLARWREHNCTGPWLDSAAWHSYSLYYML